MGSAATARPSRHARRRAGPRPPGLFFLDSRNDRLDGRARSGGGRKGAGCFGASSLDDVATEVRQSGKAVDEPSYARGPRDSPSPWAIPIPRPSPCWRGRAAETGAARGQARQRQHWRSETGLSGLQPSKPSASSTAGNSDNREPDNSALLVLFRFLPIGHPARPGDSEIGRPGNGARRATPAKRERNLLFVRRRAASGSMERRCARLTAERAGLRSPSPRPRGPRARAASRHSSISSSIFVATSASRSQSKPRSAARDVIR